MSKLSSDQIRAEVEAKGYRLVDAANYKNMKSPILIECAKGHKIEVDIETFRRNGFMCPICDGATKFEKPKNVPAKTGFRIVAFDQATEKMGVSIYDNGQLVYCDLFIFSGELISRLAKIKSLLEDIVIPNWQPDFLVFEDIQYQNNVMTFKVLAMLLGVCETVARSKNIDYDTVAPKVWRSGLGFGGRTREEEKKLARQKVREWFQLETSEDVAEAILIGKYAARYHKSARAF